MLFWNITIIDDNINVREGMFVGTEGERITYLSAEPPKDAARFGEVYNGADKLLTPGFYNAHAHSPMNLLRGYGENLALMDWLTKKIFPFEGRLTDEDVYWSSQCSIAEMLRFGIVSATDHYMFGDANCRAFIDAGMKANVALCFSNFGDEEYRALPAFAEAKAMLDNYGGGERFRLEYGPHSEYTTTERALRGLADYMRETGGAVTIHVSETASEVAGCRERHGGKSPVRYLADCGIFDVPATAAHCVCVDDEDIAILKEKRVSVASCPKSNLKLADGVCPAVKLLRAGVNLALGTDSVASNNNLNMLEELKLFALLHKGTGSLDPTVITPAEALYAATRAGALAQRREACGLIREGFKADLVVFDTDRVYMKPAYNMLSNLIYSACGTDVCLTMSDGRVLYRDGEYTTIDIERVYAEVERSRVRILGELAK